MNIRDRLQHIALALVNDRQTGSTSATVRAAKDTYGTVLAANFDQVKYLKKRFNIEARSMETNLQGISGPFFMDHYAISQLLLKAANKIESQEKEIEKMRESFQKVLAHLSDEGLLRIIADSPNLLDRASPNKRDQ